LHDAIAAERQGIPAIGVTTTRFINAAEMMCRMLGMLNYKFVAIGHPISSASQETLAEYGRHIVEQASQLLLRG
jgi:hypothetical protein